MTFIKEYIDEENHLSIIKHPDQVLMQYIVHHLQSKHDKVLSISVNQDYIRGLQAQASLSRPGDYKGKHIFEEQQYFFRKKQGNVSGELIDYFLALTGGDLKVIDQWAKTIARINLLKTNSDSIAPKITVILTPHTKLVSAWLASIYLDKGIKVTSTIPKLYRQKLSEALDFKLSGGILKIVENCGNLTSEHLKRLGKMARSIPIKQKDSAVGKLTYISNCHYLLFAKDQKEVNIYQSYFRQLADVIVCKSEFPFPDYSYDNDKFFSEWDFNWLRTVFSTYGLLLLTNDNLVYQSKSKPIEDTQQIINNFIKECCITSTEVDCYDDELYAAYTQYFLRKYGIKPIKRIHLINHLTATGKYLHCRPRHSAKDNRWGLKGISLKKDGLKQDEVTQDDAQIKKENLLKQINKINEIIFPLLELGPTVETETEKQSDKSASDAQY